MTVAVLTGRSGAGPFGGVTRGLRMCLAGIIALLTEADASAVATYPTPTEQQHQDPWHLYVVILTVILIVLGQTGWMVLKKRQATAPLMRLALAAPARPPAAAPAPAARPGRRARGARGIQLPPKRARMTMAIHRLTVDDLRDLLRRHGRVATGTKDLLIQRALTMDLEELWPDDHLTMDLLVMSTSGVEIPKMAFVDRRAALTAFAIAQAK